MHSLKCSLHLMILVHVYEGGGCNPTRSHRFFDPAFYKVVVFDQRGCGRSEPNASADVEKALHKNNTWTIVEDIEKLRLHLNISIWHCVLGGTRATVQCITCCDMY